MDFSVKSRNWLIGILSLLVMGAGAFAQSPILPTEASGWRQRLETAPRSLAADHDRLAAMQPPDPSGLESATEVVLEAIELASFELSNGSTVTLLVVPELGELGYTEVVQAGAEPVLPGEGELSPLEVFLALAPVTAPIPRALIQLDIRGDAERLAVGRARTDRLVQPIPVSMEDLELRVLVGAAGSCGSGGSSYFESHHCGVPLSHSISTYGNIDFCDANYNGGDTVWFSLTRSSYSGGWLAREASYGRTAACGTSVQIKQQYWVSGAWVTLSTQTMSSGQTYVSSWHGPQAYRRIVRSRLSSSGGFRAFTNFHNDFDITS